MSVGQMLENHLHMHIPMHMPMEMKKKTQKVLDGSMHSYIAFTRSNWSFMLFHSDTDSRP